MVELTWRPDHLAVEDNGPVVPHIAAAAAASLGGYGLQGMHERAGAHGGTGSGGSPARRWLRRAPRPTGTHRRSPHCGPTAVPHNSLSWVNGTSRRRRPVA
jgi:hypothetical protein